MNHDHLATRKYSYNFTRYEGEINTLLLINALIRGEKAFFSFVAGRVEIAKCKEKRRDFVFVRYLLLCGGK